MFVRQSTHDRLEMHFRTLSQAYQTLLREKEALLIQWNALVAQINDKGGKAFLERGVLRPRQPPQFTAEELRELVQLCHPDKHGGKESANRLTVKLNALREAQS